MTALGIYLLSSLFFVVGGMVEFAILLFFLRRSETSVYTKRKLFSVNSTNKTEARSRYEYDDRRDVSFSSTSLNVPFKTSSFNFISYSNKIDLIATIVFPISYSVFNTVYWMHYL